MLDDQRGGEASGASLLQRSDGLVAATHKAEDKRLCLLVSSDGYGHIRVTGEARLSADADRQATDNRERCPGMVEVVHRSRE